MTTEFFFGYVSISTMLLVAVTALLLKNRVYDAGSRWFRTYFVLAAIADLGMLFLVMLKENTMPVVNLFSVGQFFLLSAGIVSWISKPALKRWLRLFTCLAALVLTIYVLGTLHKKVFDVFSITTENVMLMILAAVMLLQLTEDSDQFLFKNHKFWFVVAVFLYFSVNTIVYATGNLVLDNNVNLRKYTWIINSVMSILANTIYLKGILCLPVKTT